MDDQQVYDYRNRADDPQNIIGGWLVVLAGWNFYSIISVIGNIALLSRIKLAMAQGLRTDVSSSYFSIAEKGYYLLIPFTAILLFLFFKKKKTYIYMEIANFIVRGSFLALLINSQSDFGIVFGDLGKNLAISVAVSLVFIAYLLKSKRASTTFVN